MKVAAALIARALGGATSAVQKDNESAFGDVLSGVADDAAAPTGIAKAASREASDGKATDAKAPGPATDVDADAKSDPTATLLANGSLLALVQSAALLPQAIAGTASPSRTSPSIDTASAATATSSDGTVAKPATDSDTGVAAKGGAEAASRLVKAPGDPLVDDVTVETHLAPARATIGPALGVASADAPAPQVAVSTAAPDIAQAGVPQALGKATVLKAVADKSVAAKPVAGAAATAPDAAEPTGLPTLATAAQTDARAGQSDRHAESDSGKQAVPDAADQVSADASGGVRSQPDASIVVQQASTLSAPARAVAEAVTSLAAQATQAATLATVAPARTLLVKLNSGGLGTVSVRLHLTGSTLDVSLTASHAETASLLDHDRAALTRALGDHDYQLNSLVIQGGDATSTPGGSSASTDSSGDRSASRSAGDQRGGASGGNGGRDPSPRQTGTDPVAASTGAADARGTALFV